MKRAIVALALIAAACATTRPPAGTLPTVEFEALSDVQSPYFVVFITGDGGWRKIDVKVSDVLRKAGMPVVGLLANRYFAQKRTPDEAAADLNRLIVEYQAKWQRPHPILIGFSRGAEALPIMVNRLPDSTKREIGLVALLGPGMHTNLSMEEPDRYMLVPEVKQFGEMPVLCVYGTMEKGTLCKSFGASASVVPLEGGHHFGGEYDRVAKAILDALRRRG
ncbi:MAG TPA: AcvB/VirJ family lysyl-phosphatidylglycerol hydrolase [Thermoanaerobaculia bacterium]|nr:AcvB/VirJ family lysyl-phosphatidylglycerol hydrolase [Thermoanaerobaculia bacterium]